MQLLELPELLIKKGLPFAVYSFPEKSDFRIVVQNDNEIKSCPIIDIINESGYVIADFESAHTGTFRLIRPDYILNEKSNLEEFTKDLSNENHLELKENISISQNDYLNRVEYLISELVSGKLEKIVFSRVLKKQIDKEIPLNELLSKLRSTYRTAYINMFHLPGEGTWFGASPETLFRLIDNYYYSDSLAGTRVIDESVNEPEWTNKEIIEQQLVSNFLESVLSQLGINKYDKIGPDTAIAGNLYHILTTFKIHKDSISGLEGKIIAGLHPTPAVCGLPKGDAYNLLAKAEQHERRFYSGFLGPWNIEGQSQLFVNLRCAELGKDSMNIYVGGGLTDQSKPKAEWHETIYKSRTLLSVVENL